MCISIYSINGDTKSVTSGFAILIGYYLLCYYDDDDDDDGQTIICATLCEFGSIGRECVLCHLLYIILIYGITINQPKLPHSHVHINLIAFFFFLKHSISFVYCVVPKYGTILPPSENTMCVLNVYIYIYINGYIAGCVCVFVCWSVACLCCPSRLLCELSV